MQRLILALVVASAACSGTPDDVPPPPSPSPTETTAPSVSPTASPSRSASPTPPPSADDVELALEEVATGLSAPLLVTAPEDADGIWVVEQTGTVRILGSGAPATYLDISDRVRAQGEQGLLGLAFHPDHADNGRVFVHYSGANGETVLSEFSGSARSADPSSEQLLLTVSQPAANHNGGSVVFGPDGMLYLALGDGGAAGDLFGNGQDPGTLLGAILRLDVSSPGEYSIPEDNPFADADGGAAEVFAYGLRNPYRIAFGPDGTLYIADVGQNAVEEVNAIPLDDAAGSNFGWPILEGTRCFQQEGCDPDGTVLPMLDYTHAATGGCSVIGGEVYDGTLLPGLAGHYFFSDLCAGFLRSILVEDGELQDERDWTDEVSELGRVLSIGRDATGELYVTEQNGRVLKLVPRG